MAIKNPLTGKDVVQKMRVAAPAARHDGKESEPDGVAALIAALAAHKDGATLAKVMGEALIGLTAGSIARVEVERFCRGAGFMQSGAARKNADEILPPRDQRALNELIHRLSLLSGLPISEHTRELKRYLY